MVRSAETRMKLSLANRGKKLSDVQKKRLSDANTGKKHSDVTKLKMSLVRRGKKKTREHVEKYSESLRRLWANKRVE